MHPIRRLLRGFGPGQQHIRRTKNMSQTNSSSQAAENAAAKLSSSSSSSSSLAEPAEQAVEQSRILSETAAQDAEQGSPAAASALPDSTTEQPAGLEVREDISCSSSGDDSLTEAVTALGEHIRALLAQAEAEAPVTGRESDGEGQTADGAAQAEDALAALVEALRHGSRVQVLALELYDALQNLHALPVIWRSRLSCAALLHDIGQIFGMKKHHRNTLALLLQRKSADDAVTADLVAGLVSLVPASERCLAGLIGRYHRKAWPALSHEEFAALSLQDRLGVSVCASLLRIADALDVGHTGEVKSLHVHYDSDTLVLDVEGAQGVHAGLVEHARRARAKGDLFMKLFAREITWRLC